MLVLPEVLSYRPIVSKCEGGCFPPITASPASRMSVGLKRMAMKIIGNSHVAALRDGLLMLEEQERGLFAISGMAARVERAPFFECRSSDILILDSDLARRVEALSGEPVIKAGSCWGFCFGHPGVLFNDPGWKRYRSWNLQGEDTKQPISLAALRAFVEHAFVHVLSFFESTARIGASFLILLPPPPRRNGPAIRNLGISFEQVTTIDRMVRRVLTEKARSLAIPFVDPPPESFDTDGLMKEEFQAPNRPDGREDPHHANAEYGKRMLLRILARHRVHIERDD